MKKILKIIVLLLISNYSFSQIYYSNYLNGTSEWKELSKDGAAGDFNFEYSTRFFEGFQDISGFTYYKMYKTSIIKKYTNSGYFPYFTSSISTNFLGYVREDASGKFYFRNTSGTETVYFDNQLILNAQLGNLFSNVGIYSIVNNGSTCQIDNIGILNFGGLNLKTLSFDTSQNNTSIKAVEGIGNIFPFCESPAFLDQGINNSYNNGKNRIVCYTKQGITTQFGDSSYWINDTNVVCTSFPNADRQSLNILNFNKTSIHIFPNPANNILTIETENQDTIDSIIIYNTLGQEITSIINPSNKVDVSNLETGTYFIKIKSDIKQVTLRFIKE